MNEDIFANRFGSLFEFIPSTQTTRTSWRPDNISKTKSISVDYKQMQNFPSSYTPFLDIVQ